MQKITNQSLNRAVFSATRAFLLDFITAPCRRRTQNYACSAFLLQAQNKPCRNRVKLRTAAKGKKQALPQVAGQKIKSN